MKIYLSPKKFDRMVEELEAVGFSVTYPIRKFVPKWMAMLAIVLGELHGDFKFVWEYDYEGGVVLTCYYKFDAPDEDGSIEDAIVDKMETALNGKLEDYEHETDRYVQFVIERADDFDALPEYVLEEAPAPKRSGA